MAQELFVPLVMYVQLQSSERAVSSHTRERRPPSTCPLRREHLAHSHPVHILCRHLPMSTSATAARKGPPNAHLVLAVAPGVARARQVPHCHPFLPVGCHLLSCEWQAADPATAAAREGTRPPPQAFIAAYAACSTGRLGGTGDWCRPRGAGWRPLCRGKTEQMCS